jgi:hypothetical protein
MSRLGSNMRLFRLIVDIYESEIQEYPVVTHVFNGKTKKEAMGYFRAHLTTDEFLRDCVNSGRWKTLSCHAVSRWG